MKRVFFSCFLCGFSVVYAQNSYNLYVEGKGKLKFEENDFTEFLYQFVSSHFEEALLSGVDTLKVKQKDLKSLYDEILLSFPESDKKEFISLYFGQGKNRKQKYYYTTYFKGVLNKERKDALIEVHFFLNNKMQIDSLEVIKPTSGRKFNTYKPISPKEEVRLQQEVMNAYARERLNGGGGASVNAYFEKRKRWKRGITIVK